MWPELGPEEKSAWSNIIILLGIAIYAGQTAHTVYQPRRARVHTQQTSESRLWAKAGRFETESIEANEMNGLNSTKWRADEMRGRGGLRKKREPTNLIISPCRQQRWSGQHTKSQMSFAHASASSKSNRCKRWKWPPLRRTHKPIRITLSSLETNVDSSHCRVSVLIDGARVHVLMSIVHIQFCVAAFLAATCEWQKYWQPSHTQPIWWTDEKCCHLTDRYILTYLAIKSIMRATNSPLQRYGLLLVAEHIEGCNFVWYGGCAIITWCWASECGK